MVFCTNCQTEIEDSKMFLHEGFCKKNIRYCFKCKQKIPKEEFEEHLENHKVKKETENSVEKTENKIDENNINMNIECQYCSLLVDRNELEEHEQMCGARTVPCEMCGQYVQTRLLNQHLNVIHDTGFKVNNIKKNENENEEKRRQIEEDEILARKLAEELNRYDVNDNYNSYRHF